MDTAVCGVEKACAFAMEALPTGVCGGFAIPSSRCGFGPMLCPATCGFAAEWPLPPLTDGLAAV